MRALTRSLSVGAGAACLVAGLVGVPLAHAAPPPAPQAGAAKQHVIVLLKNQHPEAPAGRATIGRRQQLVAADRPGWCRRRVPPAAVTSGS